MAGVDHTGPGGQAPEHEADRFMQHSRYYHRRFEGFMEQMVTGEDGRRRIRRVYVGDYFSQDMPDRRRVLTRILYAGLWLLARGSSCGGPARTRRATGRCMCSSSVS